MKADAAFAIWKQKIPEHLRYAFKELLTAFRNWHHEIFNHFDYPVTNAFTEAANNLVKSLQRQSRGASFEFIRAKILYQGILKRSENGGNANGLINGRYQTTFAGPANIPKTQRVRRLRKSREANDVFFELMKPLQSFSDRLGHFIKDNDC